MNPATGTPRLPLWLAALALAVGLAHQWLLLPFLGEDEPWHLEYVEHVAAGHRPAARLVADSGRIQALTFSQLQIGGRFPSASDGEIRALQSELLGALDDGRIWERVDWAPDPGGATSFDAIHLGITAAAQPPGYYLLAGAWLRLCPADDATARLRWVRWLSLACFLIVVAASHGVGALLGGPAVGAAAGSIAALMPMHARQAATVNPDVLAKVLVALAIWGAARWMVRGGRGSIALVLACCVAAPWVKSTALTALAPALAVGALALRDRLGARRTALAVVAAGAIGIGALAALGKSPVVPANLERAVERVGRGLSTGNLLELYRTLLGAFGWYGRTLPIWFAVAAAAPLTLGLVGLARAGFSGRDPGRGATFRRDVAGLLALCALAQLTAIVLRGEAAGRYLYPALPALAALFALGWGAAVGRRAAAPSLSFLLAFWLGLAVAQGAILHERIELGS